MATYDLPTELWMEVFSYLDYLTLRRGVSLTCRYFTLIIAALEERSELDVTLFRDTCATSLQDADTEPKKLTDYALHPFLAELGFELIGGFCYHWCHGLRAVPPVPVCQHDGLGLFKKFHSYDEIPLFAKLLHELRFPAKVLNEHCIAPAIPTYALMFTLQGMPRYRTFAPFGEIQLGRTVATCAVHLHFFWIEVLAPYYLRECWEGYGDDFEESYSRIMARYNPDLVPDESLLAMDLLKMHVTRLRGLPNS